MLGRAALSAKLHSMASPYPVCSDDKCTLSGDCLLVLTAVWAGAGSFLLYKLRSCPRARSRPPLGFHHFPMQL